MINKQIILIIFVVFITDIYAQNFDRNRIDVLSYDINLDIRDFKTERISGFTTVKFVLQYEHSDTLSLDFAGLTADSVKRSQHDMVSFKQQGEQLLVFSDFKKTDSITVYYHGKPMQDKAWGGFFFSDSVAFNMGVGMASYPHSYGRVWFPCNDSFTDKATYYFDITVPPNMIAVCSGVLDRVYLPNDKTYHRFIWYMDRQIPTYIANVAVGKYDRLEQTYQGLKRKIPIELYFRTPYAKNIEQSFRNLKTCLGGFEKHYGEYVWQRVGYVGVPFESGAMEHCCNISYPEYAADGEKTHETLMAHELSHHWFGNLVTCKTSQDMWLNEGWASFSEALFTEDAYGVEAYKKYVRDNHLKVLTMTHKQDGGYYAVYGVSPDLTYGSTVYDKGADVAHTLRGYMGDSLFFTSLTSYFRDFAYKSADTYEFRDYLSKVSGLDLTDFFDTWVFTPGFPHFSAKIVSVTKNSNGYKVETEILQSLKARTLYGKKIKADVMFVNNSLQTHIAEITFGGERTLVTSELPFMPTAVFFDPDEKISDAKVDCLKRINKTGTHNFEYVGFKLSLQKYKQDLLCQASQNFIPPRNNDSETYTLSAEKYWTIQSNSKSYKAQGIFYVSAPEHGFMKTVDELVLFYRPDEDSAWQPCDFTRDKKHNYEAYFIVEKLKCGDYAIGFINVKDE